MQAWWVRKRHWKLLEGNGARRTTLPRPLQPWQRLFLYLEAWWSSRCLQESTWPSRVLWVPLQYRCCLHWYGKDSRCDLALLRGYQTWLWEHWRVSKPRTVLDAIESGNRRGRQDVPAGPRCRSWELRCSWGSPTDRRGCEPALRKLLM